MEVYTKAVKSAMLNVHETWCLCQNEIGILQITERAKMRAMCGEKLVDKKSTKDLMQLLDLNEIIDQLIKIKCVRWHRHVLRKIIATF